MKQLWAGDHRCGRCRGFGRGIDHELVANLSSSSSRTSIKKRELSQLELAEVNKQFLLDSQTKMQIGPYNPTIRHHGQIKSFPVAPSRTSHSRFVANRSERSASGHSKPCLEFQLQIVGRKHLQCVQKMPSKNRKNPPTDFPCEDSLVHVQILVTLKGRIESEHVSIHVKTEFKTDPNAVRQGSECRRTRSQGP